MLNLVPGYVTLVVRFLGNTHFKIFFVDFISFPLFKPLEGKTNRCAVLLTSFWLSCSEFLILEYSY